MIERFGGAANPTARPTAAPALRAITAPPALVSHNSTARPPPNLHLSSLHAKREEWAARGHGALGEVVEREFFKEMKGEERAVVLFYRSSPPCLAMERALRALAPKHMETRFVRVEAEKAPFLTQRLRVWMLPTLAILKDGAATDYIVGLDDVGGREDFADEALEARLAALGAVFEEAQPRAAAAAREGGGGGGGGGGSGGVRQGGERRRADSDEDSDFD